MGTLKATVECCLCPEELEFEMTIPDGWEHQHGHISSDKAFCPKHAPIRAFEESQCPGCVGGWTDCDMWNAFAYPETFNMTEADYLSLELGICPRRTNGTFWITNLPQGRKAEHIDLSNAAPVEAGRAFAQAIRDYLERYRSAYERRARS